MVHFSFSPRIQFFFGQILILLALLCLFRCKSYERAKKKLTIEEAPNILTIALKRYQVPSRLSLSSNIYILKVLYEVMNTVLAIEMATTLYNRRMKCLQLHVFGRNRVLLRYAKQLPFYVQSGKFGKISKAIRFPETLNMLRYMNPDTDDISPIYSLYAVVVHHDVMNAAFSGHYVCYVKDTQGKWFKADDSQVCLLFVDISWFCCHEQGLFGMVILSSKFLGFSTKYKVIHENSFKTGPCAFQ